MLSGRAISIGVGINLATLVVAGLITGFVMTAMTASSRVEFVALGSMLAAGSISGFVAGRRAGGSELLHAAAVALPSTLLDPMVRLLTGVSLWQDATIGYWLLLIVPCALLGGYASRLERPRSPADRRPASWTRKSAYPGLFTYTTMTVWALVETVKSFTGIGGTMGLRFMFYEDALGFVAFIVAVMASSALLFFGTGVHRLRVVSWYGLALLFGVSTFAGGAARWAAGGLATLFPTMWAVRAALERPKVEPYGSAQHG